MQENDALSNSTREPGRPVDSTRVRWCCSRTVVGATERQKSRRVQRTTRICTSVSTPCQILCFENNLLVALQNVNQKTHFRGYSLASMRTGFATTAKRAFPP